MPAKTVFLRDCYLRKGFRKLVSLLRLYEMKSEIQSHRDA